MATAAKNHTVSRSYLGRWTDDSGRLQVEIRHAGMSVPRLPEAVGYRKKFWGADPAMREATEQFLSTQFETGDALSILRALPDSWPIDHDREQWTKLLLFVALHIVRTPQWQREGRSMQERSLSARVTRWQETMPPEAVASVLRHVQSDRFHADLMLGQIPKTASVLGSMHCALLTSGTAPLLSSDHPVVAVPLLRDGESAPIKLIPERGLSNTIEFRFPIGPRHALLFTWLDEPIHEEIVELPLAAVCDLNVSVVYQAESEVYYRPGDRPPVVCPPFAPGPCSPISPRLFPRYGPDVARDSLRRRNADATMRDLIDNEITNEVRIARVEWTESSTPRP
jgi:hypothetical protein